MPDNSEHPRSLRDIIRSKTADDVEVDAADSDGSDEPVAEPVASKVAVAEDTTGSVGDYFSIDSSDTHINDGDVQLGAADYSTIPTVGSKPTRPSRLSLSSMKPKVERPAGDNETNENGSARAEGGAATSGGSGGAGGGGRKGRRITSLRRGKSRRAAASSTEPLVSKPTSQSPVESTSELNTSDLAAEEVTVVQPPAPFDDDAPIDVMPDMDEPVAEEEPEIIAEEEPTVIEDIEPEFIAEEEAEVVAEVEPEPEVYSEPELEYVADDEPEPVPLAEAVVARALESILIDEPEDEAEIEPEAVVEPEPTPEPEVQAGGELESEPEAEPEVVLEVVPDLEPEPESVLEVVPDLEPEPEPEPEPILEVVPDPVDAEPAQVESSQGEPVREQPAAGVVAPEPLRYTARRATPTPESKISFDESAPLPPPRPVYTLGQQGTLNQLRRIGYSIIFVPILIVWGASEFVHSLLIKFRKHRVEDHRRQVVFRRPSTMPRSRDDRSVEHVVAQLKQFPHYPLKIPPQLAFYREFSADGLGILLSSRHATSSLPHLYPGIFRPRLFAGSEGVTLAGLQAMHETPGPALIICHGVFTTKNFDYIRLMALKAYSRWGFHVVTIDLRSFGQSEWTTDAPSSAGWGEGRDIANIARELHDNPLVTSVGVLGYSLGGCSALNAAHYVSQNPEPGEHPHWPLDGGVLTLSAPTDMREAITHFSTRPTWRHPFFGLWLLFRTTLQAAVRERGLDKNISRWDELTEKVAVKYYGIDPETYYSRASAVNWADEITVPTLDLHAEDDFVVPVEHAYELENVVRDNENCNVWVVERGSHISFASVDARWFNSVTRRWFEYWANEPDSPHQEES